MKTQPCLGAILIALILPWVRADFAPTSLEYGIMVNTVTSGSLPFADHGTTTMGCMRGNWFSYDASGNVAPSGIGTYYYQKTGPNSAIFSPTRTNLSPIFGPSGTLDFTSATTGTLTLTGTYNGNSGSAKGTFIYTPLIAQPRNTGVALLEAYEVSGELNSLRRLSNISTRAFVGAGDQVLIGGFVTVGSAPQTLLIRAIGPTLAKFGVAGTLTQPKLTLTDSKGNSIASNVGWKNAPVLGNSAVKATIQSVTVGQMSALGAFALIDEGSDSAMLAVLPPGAYSFIVSMD